MRRRIHNHVEAAFLLAQHLSGYVYYDHPVRDRERLRICASCASTNIVRNVLDSGLRVYFVNARIYAPHKCLLCNYRYARVTKTRQRK